MRKLGIIFITLSVLCFIGCCAFALNAHDKYTNYYNNSEYSFRSKNAYVGGDAYNYIINGTYFTAFAVCAAGCGIGGTLFLISGSVLIAMNTMHDTTQKIYKVIPKSQGKSTSYANDKEFRLFKDPIFLE